MPSPGEVKVSSFPYFIFAQGNFHPWKNMWKQQSSEHRDGGLSDVYGCSSLHTPWFWVASVLCTSYFSHFPFLGVDWLRALF